MGMKKPAFKRYKLDEEKEKEKGKVFTIRLNEAEIKRLENDAYLLEQEKPSTTLKILAELGHNVLHDQLTGKVLRTLFKNRRNNKRLGISEVEPKF